MGYQNTQVGEIAGKLNFTFPNEPGGAELPLIYLPGSGHNQRKVKTTEDKQRERVQQSKARATEYIALKDQFLDFKSKLDVTQDALKLTTKLLALAPDCYTYWNYRKRILLNLFQDEEGKLALQTAELAWTESCLPRNPKSYWIWFHRKWLSQGIPEFDWKREIALCDTLLEKDQRNFHCWNYRRYIAEAFQAPKEGELAFTLKKIEENFSNYSAWHQRSYLLPQVYDDPEKFNAVISEELEMVQNAFYTSPSDQSAWFYHRWLLGMTKKHNPQHFEEIVRIELQKVEELLPEEPDAKWPILTTVFLLQELGQNQELVEKRLQQLQEIDSDHKNFYLNLLTNSTSFSLSAQ